VHLESRGRGVGVPLFDPKRLLELEGLMAEITQKSRNLMR